MCLWHGFCLSVTKSIFAGKHNIQNGGMAIVTVMYAEKTNRTSLCGLQLRSVYCNIYNVYIYM